MNMNAAPLSEYTFDRLRGFRHLGLSEIINKGDFVDKPKLCGHVPVEMVGRKPWEYPDLTPIKRFEHESYWEELYKTDKWVSPIKSGQ